MPDTTMSRAREHGVVVTGSSRGIGQGVAKMFTDEGATVVGIDLRDPDETAKLCGARFHPVTADVANEAALQSAFGEVDEVLGARFDIMCAVAGIAPSIAFVDTPVDVFDRTMAVNVRGVFLCGQAAARRMLARGSGRIINIASTASVQAWALQSAYGASKGAVNVLTKCMAVELAGGGVLVNAVAPGSIATPLGEDFMSNSAWADHDLARTPLRRWGHPGDIAAAVRFLAFDASWMTGQTIYVDGGFLATGGPMLEALEGHVSIER
jgi:NAD(P)-dependent dehydrogenase (short-subunit alcohol dehydrogenase family)